MSLFASEEPSPVLVGERVLLRHPTAHDQDAYIALRKASEEFLRPWDPRPPAGVDPYSREVFRAWLKGSTTQGRLRFLIVRREDGVLLGGINLNEIVRGVFDCAFLGYWIGAPFARQGYMGEALELAMQFAFGELGLHRLEANIRPENAASIALVRRAGFRKEGFSPRYLKIDGDWRDHERWAILVEDRGGRRE